MTTESYLVSVIKGEQEGPVPSLIRAALAIPALLYMAGLEAYLLPYRLGVRRRMKLPVPVISIGNLTAGGTGKTPMTQRVAEFLVERGVKVVILSRGYRGANEHGAAIVSDGKRLLLDAKEAGDEAYLLAQLLPRVPVIVGKDRRDTGLLACERFLPDVILLDDGMQFYQLHRDMDIVLVDALRPFDNGWTFPRGLLREPPSHIRRAHCVVVTNTDKVERDYVDRLRARLARMSRGAPVFAARFAPSGLRALDRSCEQSLLWLDGRKVASFCALGNPGNFEEQLRRSGAELVYQARFPDHHQPTVGELNETIARACAAEAEAIIVSEKDAVKLPPLNRPLPFFAFLVRQRVDDDGAFFAHVLKALG